MRLLKWMCFVVLAMTLSAPAVAESIPLTVSMDGAQANAGAGSGSTATGSAELVFDTATKELSWSITWSGLFGAPTLMHFHGPALPNQNAAVVVSTGVVGPPVVGSAFLSAGHEADLLAGLWYLNLHTDSFPAGEIRGQVIAPEPSPSTGPFGLGVLAGLLILAAGQRHRFSIHGTAPGATRSCNR